MLPGGVIMTGTPFGVGFAREQQLFMKAGDTVEVDIEGIGRLANPVEEAWTPPADREAGFCFICLFTQIAGFRAASGSHFL